VEGSEAHQLRHDADDEKPNTLILPPPEALSSLYELAIIGDINSLNNTLTIEYFGHYMKGEHQRNEFLIETRGKEDKHARRRENQSTTDKRGSSVKVVGTEIVCSSESR